MNNIKFRMVAYTGAAGKYDPQAPMSGNEDNFYVDDNLSDDIPSHCNADEIIEMNDCGCIMAVCDGMGGMNAGEVASAIAIQTVQEYFAPQNITCNIASSSTERERYLEKLVIDAHKRIKDDAQNIPEHNGMGSTIILAWLVGNELTITWCGDSRAYRFNTKTGLQILSEDHSYVQDLVKKGLITYEDTFDHPQGNIITRSLGDPSKKAKPETRHFSVNKGDIILLCSDGLSGVIRDKKTKDPEGNYYDGENIEDIIRNNSSTMTDCKNALWKAAEEAGWYDNVTILLCQIIDGPKNDDNVNSKTIDLYQKKDTPDKPIIDKREGCNENKTTDRSFWNNTLHFQVKFKPKLLIYSVAGIICGILLIFLIQKINKENTDSFLKDKNYLLEAIKEKNDFMKARGLPIDSLYFKNIRDSITNIRDSTGLKNVSKLVSDFISDLDAKTKIIEIVDEAISSQNNKSQIVEQLNILKQNCLHNDWTEDELKDSIKRIIDKGAKQDATKDLKNKKGRPSSIPQEAELTPVIDTLHIEFQMLPYPNYIGQIKNLKKTQENNGYKYIGIYLNRKEVSANEYSAGKTYTMIFAKSM